MKIFYTKNDQLPPLAWYACVKNDTVNVICGSFVECFDDCFFEGAWSGNFNQVDFLNADWFCGTGAHITNDSIVFSTPSHVTYGIYVNSLDEGYCVSNSIYFLMAMRNFRYDTKYIGYEVDFNTILDGINSYKNYIHVLNEKNEKTDIKIEYFKNITITNNGNYISINKQPVKPFESFDDYYHRLSNDIIQMTQNAADVKRQHQYGMVTTISQGYDAPCCAAIAKLAGCDTAVTFSPQGKYKDDCGTDIAKALKYNSIIEVDANEYIKRKDIVEAEYICSGELGALISFSSFDKFVAGNILFTGERGDSIWGKNSTNHNNEFAFISILSHLGNAERRLWLNCICVPMPLYGASQWDSIFNISNSKQMASWSLGNNYDRPIARRIVEESGVPREMFGMTKHGAGFVYKFDWLSRICEKMSPKAAESFSNYVAKNKIFRPIRTISFFWKLRGIYLKKLGFKVKNITCDTAKIANPMCTSLLIPWAGEIVTKKYNEILNGD